MAYEVSRRSFLKGAATLTVAVAASGLLAGCGGGSNTGFAVGDYRISDGTVEYWGVDSQGRYTIETTMKIKKVSAKSWDKWFSIFKDKNYADVFSADKMTLLNGNAEFGALDKNEAVICSPRFYTTDKDLFDRLVNGEEMMKLKVELARNQSSTFNVDVKNKTINGTI